MMRAHNVDRAAGGETDQPVYRAIRIVGGGCRRDGACEARQKDQIEDGCAKNCDHNFPVIPVPLSSRASSMQLTFDAGQIHAFIQIGFCLPCLLANSLAGNRV
jgi:hypothetical protein